MSDMWDEIKPKKQNSLDEKLREILIKYKNWQGVLPSEDYQIAQIKQAFADEGYIKVREGTSPNNDSYFVCQVCGNHVQEQFRELHAALHDKPELKNYMPGQEWYDRFEKEFEAMIREDGPSEANYKLDDITYLDDFAAKDILRIAKRAAGLD